jgi:hypothetical protein
LNVTLKRFESRENLGAPVGKVIILSRIETYTIEGLEYQRPKQYTVISKYNHKMSHICQKKKIYIYLTPQQKNLK